MFFKKRLITAALVGAALLLALALLIQNRLLHRKMGAAPDIQSGPWGEMQVWDLHLEQPIEYVSFDRTGESGPFWNFGLLSEQTVRAILSEAGCGDELITRLLAARVPQKDGTFVICPPEEVLLSLPPEVRSKLYLKLAAQPQNRLQRDPYVIPRGDLGKMLRGRFKNSPEIEGMLRRLCYPRNGYVYFSDPEVILRHLQGDPGAREEFLKFMTSMDVVMARILVRPDSQIDLPVIYWGLPVPGLLVKDLYPLFEAQRALPDGGSIPLSYLLTPAARESLYKTPLSPKGGQKAPDCHWTALTFFSFHPDPRVADTKFASRYLLENYYEIGKPTLPCDLVLLLNGRNEVIHSAVHLAGDIVYTKNGVNIGEPWVLMHEKDMIAHFSALEPVRVAYMRPRDY